MNPYGSQYLHPTDQAFCWGLAAVLATLIMLYVRKRFESVQVRSERWCISAGWALLLLGACIAANSIIGYVLFKLEIQTAFMMFWIVLYFTGMIWTFYVFPVFTLCLISWAFIGTRRAQYTTMALKLGFTCFLAIIVNATLYIVFTLNPPVR